VTVVEVTRFASFGEVVNLRTFCGGTGGRWAERRVSLTGDAGAAMQAATLWVHLDTVTQRPKPLPAQFFELFGEAAGGRTVHARLHHPEPPSGATSEPWPLRCSDIDVLGHMNNAAYWEIVEDHLARRRDLRAPLRAELEFRAAVEPDHHIDVVTLDGPDDLSLWVVAEPGVCASAVVRRWA